MQSRDLAIRILRPKPEATYHFRASYGNAPVETIEVKEPLAESSADFDPILEGPRLRTIVRQLKEAGFVPLPGALDEHLALNGGRMTAKALRKFLVGHNQYSYRAEGLPKQATPLERARNPFLDYSAALNETGTYSAVCGAQNLLETEILNQYFAGKDPYYAEVRTSFANTDQDNKLTFAEAHARGYVYRSPDGTADAAGGAPLILDATPSRNDWEGGKKREDRLPWHGSTHENQRSHMKGLSQRKRDEEELERFHQELEEGTLAMRTQPETPQESLMRRWLDRVAAGNAAGLRHPTVYLSDEALQAAEPFYGAVEDFRKAKKGIGKQGAALRRQKLSSKLREGDPVTRAIRLINQAAELIADAPDQESWDSRSGKIRSDANKLRTYISDLIALHEVAALREAGITRRHTYKPTPAQKESLKRIRIDPSAKKLPPLGSLADQEMHDLVMQGLALVEGRLDDLPRRGVEGLRQVRLYQHEIHRSRLSGYMNEEVERSLRALPDPCLGGVLDILRDGR